MPRENKKRGKRGGSKRKHDEVADGEPETAKRTRLQDGEPTNGDAADGLADNNDYMALDQPDGDHQEAYSGTATEQVFFGMLDEDEQEFFKKADERLELDDFEGPEDKAQFLENVYKEADGKELKLACSQSCSRVLERLIHLSSPSQLSKLFQKFNGHFLHLVQHRFASHCSEKLFVKAAPIVTEELLRTDKSQPLNGDDVYVSMEDLFLHTVAELESNLGFLITDRFGSHALRVLLLVLAGEPLTSSSQKSILQSKRKENVTGGRSAPAQEGEIRLDQRRTVPKSFNQALEKILNDCATGLHTAGLRTLATHQLGSPILQVLVRLELVHFGKQRAKDEHSIIRTLIPEEPVTQETESAGFLNGLNYDAVGSHVLEAIIENAPGKMFKHLYKEFWKDRMASLSRNEVAAYIVCKLLERLGRDDLIEAHEAIVAVIPDLLERNRISVIKTLIQRCAVRNVDTQAIAVALSAYYTDGVEDDFDVLKLLHLDKAQLEESYHRRPRVRHPPEGSLTARQTVSVEPSEPPPPPAQATRPSSTQDPGKVQGSILAQAMILVAGPLSGLIFESMSRLPPRILIAMAIDPVTSRTLQATMTSTNASIIPRRKLVQQFYGHIGEMALDTSASHVVDAIWEGTHGLAFIRERIAEELAENEASLRESPCGRAVWKNWKMDLYKRRRPEWVMQSRNKASNDGFQSFEELDLNKKKMEGVAGSGNGKGVDVVQDGKQDGVKEKTPLEKARERHFKKKQQSKERRNQTSGSSAGASGAAGPSKTTV
ncbi:nucleolar protein-3 [Elsinoe australis]|uniref:Nucleolar protein 9 n=1 Tax=Elsinoe australis TaxID=40998 RepID=A0A4U7B5S8_9PEZI|nr:nucleolar protein-3 [Elsinoe australis]